MVDSPENTEAQAESETIAPEMSAELAAQAEASAVVEAVLFTSDSPLTTTKIGTAAELPGRVVKKAIAELNERYEQVGAAFRIEPIAGGFQMLTLPAYRDVEATASVLVKFLDNASLFAYSPLHRD